MATEERLFEPELHRLRAELLVGQGAEPARVEAARCAIGSRAGSTTATFTRGGPCCGYPPERRPRRTVELQHDAGADRARSSVPCAGLTVVSTKVGSTQKR